MENVLSSLKHPIGRCPIDNKTATRTLKTRWRRVLRKMPISLALVQPQMFGHICVDIVFSATHRQQLRQQQTHWSLNGTLRMH